jgi:hypothetical protein
VIGDERDLFYRTLVRQQNVSRGADALGDPLARTPIDFGCGVEEDAATIHIRRTNERYALLDELVRSGPTLAMVAVLNA